MFLFHFSSGRRICRRVCRGLGEGGGKERMMAAGTDAHDTPFCSLHMHTLYSPLSPPCFAVVLLPVSITKQVFSKVSPVCVARKNAYASLWPSSFPRTSHASSVHLFLASSAVMLHNVGRHKHDPTWGLGEMEKQTTKRWRNKRGKKKKKRQPASHPSFGDGNGAPPD